MHVIKLQLSESAQRKAILEGLPHAQKNQSIEVKEKEDIEALLKLPWTYVDDMGQAICAVPVRLSWDGPHSRTDLTEVNESLISTHGGYGGVDCLAPVMPLTVKVALRWAESLVPTALEALKADFAKEKAEREAQEAKDRAAVAKWLSFPPEDRASHEGICDCLLTDGKLAKLVYSGARFVSTDELRRYASKELDEAYALRDKRRVEREAKAEREKQEKRDLLAALYRQTPAGSADPRFETATKEYPLGCIPEDEALSAIRDLKLPVSEDLPAYKRLKNSDAPTCEVNYFNLYEEDGCEPQFSSETLSAIDDLDRATYEAIRETRAKLVAAGLPAGQIVKHCVACGCSSSDCSATKDRFGLRVRLELGHGVAVTHVYGIGID